MNNNPSKEYLSVFELGIINFNPAVKVLKECEMCPITLAAMVTALFETVMRTVDESKQNAYEKAFNKALKKIMKDRHNYDITYRQINIDEDPY